ncbi:MAG: HEAT repeat domain-containing protein [bacterium]
MEKNLENGAATGPGGARGGDHARRLLHRLRDPERCWAAAVELERRRLKSAAPGLLELLYDPMPPHTARCVVWLAGALGVAKAAERLITILRDAGEDVETRRGAAFSLGKLKNDAAVPALTESLRESELRWNAAQALGRFPDRVVANVLMNSLRDPDAGVREGAAWALAELSSQRTLGALEAAMNDDDPAVRRGAAWAIRRIEKKRLYARYRHLFTSHKTLSR